MHRNPVSASYLPLALITVIMSMPRDPSQNPAVATVMPFRLPICNLSGSFPHAITKSINTGSTQQQKAGGQAVENVWCLEQSSGNNVLGVQSLKTHVQLKESNLSKARFATHSPTLINLWRSNAEIATKLKFLSQLPSPASFTIRKTIWQNHLFLPKQVKVGNLQEEDVSVDSTLEIHFPN